MTSDPQRPLTTVRERGRVCSGLFQSYVFAGRVVGVPAGGTRLLSGCALSCMAGWRLKSSGEGTVQTVRWFWVGAWTHLFCSSADFYDVLKSLALYRCLLLFVKLNFSKEVKDYLEGGTEERQEIPSGLMIQGLEKLLLSRNQGSVKTVSFL